MSFKLHLTIICLIVVAVYMAWTITNRTPVQPVPIEAKTTPYQLSITHATWGANCRNLVIDGAAPQNDPFANKANESKLRDDNVLSQVSLLCNGKQQCDILIDPSALGEDPSPSCTKTFDVEYRCFSYDRPWNISTMNTGITLRCSAPPSTAGQPQQ